MKNYYITTTLPYVNEKPHIGHALEFVQADVVARWKKSQGNEVFFNTGTDEHGQKVFDAANKAGKDIQKYVDEYAQNFKELLPRLDISKDVHFVRTSDSTHAKAVQALWKHSMDKGDIYKKKYKGLYCVADEAFVRESDLINGRCPNHPTLDLKEIEEENYFFKLENYKEDIREYLGRQTIIPDWRAKEALSTLEGMEDFSISREKKRLNWGIPVPNDDTQVIYVWFDALINYISTLGWPDEEGDFKKFWKEGYKLQLAGKDQVKFQSIIWQAMLMSADLANTDLVFYHGFINSGGQKMSKSLGNVIGPHELIEKYGPDATRYILLRHIHPTEDTDVTWEKLDEWYTANLVNGLGNLVARIMRLAELYLTGDTRVSAPTFSIDYIEALDKFDFSGAMDIIFDRISSIDKKITETEPFKLIKSNPAEGTELILKLILDLYIIGFLLEPFMPETAKTIKEAVENHKKPENLFPRLA